MHNLSILQRAKEEGKRTYLKESNHKKEKLKKITGQNNSEKKKHRAIMAKEWEK